MITVLSVMLYFEFNLTVLLAAYLAIFHFFIYILQKKIKAFRGVKTNI